MADINVPGVNPLTEDHLLKINQRLAELDLADAQITLARQAGIDVDEVASRSKDARERLLRIKQAYFPNR